MSSRPIARTEADNVIAVHGVRVDAESGGHPRRPADGRRVRKYVAQFKGNNRSRGSGRALHTEGTPAGYSTDQEFIKGIR